jgi:Skp family chaperone for outer membrane proteins
MSAGTRTGPSVSVLFLAATLSLACPSVSVDATRNPKYPGPIPPPVAVVIVEGRPGPDYSRPLEKYLTRELGRNGITPTIRVLTDADDDQKAVLKSLEQTANALVLIVPAGGVTYEGTYKEIYYDVRAFLVTREPEPKTTSVWSARVDTNSGALGVQVDARLDKFAVDLVGRLVGDGVLDAPHASNRPIAVVDMTRALRECREGRAAIAELKAAFASDQAQLDQRQAALKLMLEQIKAERERGLPVAEREAAAAKETRALKAEYVRLQKDLSDLELRRTVPIEARLESTLSKLVEARGLGPVKRISPIIPGVDREVDITPDLIRAMDRPAPIPTGPGRDQPVRLP